jgi:hypothetical protein
MTWHNFRVDLDDATYRAALGRAQSEGKTLEQILAGFFATYTEGLGGDQPTEDEPGSPTLQVFAKPKQAFDAGSGPARMIVPRVRRDPIQIVVSMKPLLDVEGENARGLGWIGHAQLLLRARHDTSIGTKRGQTFPDPALNVKPTSTWQAGGPGVH